MKKRLTDVEWNFASIPEEQFFPCHHWEFSRTAVLEASPDYVHEGLDPYAKYGTFAAPWPRVPFAELDGETRKLLASNYHKNAGLHALDFKHFTQNYDDACDTPQTLFAFQIDWTHSDNNLRDCFEAWLKEKRPPEIQEQEVRGRAPARQLEADLRALGIYRIIMFHHESSVSEIINQYKTGFRDETAWSKAKVRASRVLKAFR